MGGSEREGSLQESLHSVSSRRRRTLHLSVRDSEPKEVDHAAAATPS